MGYVALTMHLRPSNYSIGHKRLERVPSNQSNHRSRQSFIRGSTVATLVVIYMYVYLAGLAMNQIELEKIADFFDKDHSGTIDLSEILRVLKGNRRGKYVVQEALSDAEKIENEVCLSKNL